MLFRLIEISLAATPFVLISVALYVGWRVLWKLFDDLFDEK